MVAVTYVPTSVYTRQERERETLEKLYTLMEVGIETDTGVSAIAKKVGISYSQMNKITLNLEKSGILTRRSTWSRDDTGRSSFWSLRMSKEDALSTLTDFQSHELDGFLTNRSLKTRMLQAIQEQGKFATVLDILNYIREPNENIDLHNMTHVLNSLREQGQVSFVRGKGKTRTTSNENVPYNITYTGEEMTPLTKESLIIHTQPAYNSEWGVPEVSTAPVVVPAEESAPVSIYAALSDAYPLIANLARRREFLVYASELADKANETELALELLAKSQTESTSIEEEIIRLWLAHISCLTK